MTPKTIGIVGGAGPLAAVSLLNRLFRYAQSECNCYQDSDFPKVILISFPFSDMLKKEVNPIQIAQELKECLSFLKKNGASLLAIACNTLHNFLDEEMKENLLSLPQATLSEVQKTTTKPALILCTSTSRSLALYDTFFPCMYPDSATQNEVDEIILSILKGEKNVHARLEKLIENQPAETIVLGCTELSLVTDQLTLPQKLIIDPLEIVAKNMIQKSFS
jgi:aspartate racemase